MVLTVDESKKRRRRDDAENVDVQRQLRHHDHEPSSKKARSTAVAQLIAPVAAHAPKDVRPPLSDRSGPRMPSRSDGASHCDTKLRGGDISSHDRRHHHRHDRGDERRPTSDSELLRCLIDRVDKLTKTVKQTASCQDRLEDMIWNEGHDSRKDTRMRLRRLEDLVKDTASRPDASLEKHTIMILKAMKSIQTNVSDSLKSHSEQVTKDITTVLNTAEMNMNISNENMARRGKQADEKLEQLVRSTAADTDETVISASNNAVQQLTRFVQGGVKTIIDDMNKMLDMHRGIIKASLAGTDNGGSFASLQQTMNDLKPCVSGIQTTVNEDLVMLGGELGSLKIAMNDMKAIIENRHGRNDDGMKGNKQARDAFL